MGITEIKSKDFRVQMTQVIDDVRVGREIFVITLNSRAMAALVPVEYASIVDEIMNNELIGEEKYIKQKIKNE